jgi:hypothetical protein
MLGLWWQNAHALQGVIVTPDPQLTFQPAIDARSAKLVARADAAATATAAAATALVAAPESEPEQVEAADAQSVAASSAAAGASVVPRSAVATHERLHQQASEWAEVSHSILISFLVFHLV